MKRSAVQVRERQYNFRARIRRVGRALLALPEDDGEDDASTLQLSTTSSTTSTATNSTLTRGRSSTSSTSRSTPTSTRSRREYAEDASALQLSRATDSDSDPEDDGEASVVYSDVSSSVYSLESYYNEEANHHHHPQQQQRRRQRQRCCRWWRLNLPQSLLVLALVGLVLVMTGCAIHFFVAPIVEWIGGSSTAASSNGTSSYPMGDVDFDFHNNNNNNQDEIEEVEEDLAVAVPFEHDSLNMINNNNDTDDDLFSTMFSPTASPTVEGNTGLCGSTEAVNKTGLVALSIRGLHPLYLADEHVNATREAMQSIFKASYNNISGMCLDPMARILQRATLVKWETTTTTNEDQQQLLAVDRYNPAAAQAAAALGGGEVIEVVTHITTTFWKAIVSCEGCPNHEPLFADPDDDDDNDSVGNDEEDSVTTRGFLVDDLEFRSLLGTKDTDFLTLFSVSWAWNLGSLFRQRRKEQEQTDNLLAAGSDLKDDVTGDGATGTTTTASSTSGGASGSGQGNSSSTTGSGLLEDKDTANSGEGDNGGNNDRGDRVGEDDEDEFFVISARTFVSKSNDKKTELPTASPTISPTGAPSTIPPTVSPGT